MRVETRKGRLWSQLIRPILWPLLAAQALLVALCLVIGLTWWWLVPTHASWSITFWLLLSLLVGSGLNVAVFLMLLKQRLRACEGGLEAALGRVDTFLQRHCQGPADDVPSDIGDPARPLVQRLDAMIETFESLVAHWRVELERSRDAERRLADDLQAQQGRLERLETGRVRAREESRLKSDYLSHLQQALTPLMTSVDEVLASGVFGRCVDDTERAVIQGLRERLADAAVLLENLGDGPPAEGEGAPAREGRVLIVDDGPVNLMLAQQVLERQGLRVATATSGAEALERLAREPFDLIFMDIFMADMDGVETCRAWREREADLARETRSVVVALTANAGEADRRRFREAGMDDYLAKPYRPQALLETLRYWLPGVFEAVERP